MRKRTLVEMLEDRDRFAQRAFGRRVSSVEIQFAESYQRKPFPICVLCKYRLLDGLLDGPFGPLPPAETQQAIAEIVVTMSYQIAVVEEPEIAQRLFVEIDDVVYRASLFQKEHVGQIHMKIAEQAKIPTAFGELDGFGVVRYRLLIIAFITSDDSEQKQYHCRQPTVLARFGLIA